MTRQGGHERQRSTCFLKVGKHAICFHVNILFFGCMSPAVLAGGRLLIRLYFGYVGEDSSIT